MRVLEVLLWGLLGAINLLWIVLVNIIFIPTLLLLLFTIALVHSTFYEFFYTTLPLLWKVYKNKLGGV